MNKEGSNANAVSGGILARLGQMALCGPKNGPSVDAMARALV